MFNTSYDKIYRCLLKKLGLAKKQAIYLILLNRCLTLSFALLYLFVLFLAFQSSARLGFFLLGLSALSFVLVSFFRYHIDAKRPYEKWQIEPLLPARSQGKSFPSRHVFSATLISMCALRLSLSLGFVCFLLALTLSLVRVLGGVHYPRDVFWAYVLAIFIGLVFFLV